MLVCALWNCGFDLQTLSGVTNAASRNLIQRNTMTMTARQVNLKVNSCLKILMGILTPSGGKIKISIVNLLGSFYPNEK